MNAPPRACVGCWTLWGSPGCRDALDAPAGPGRCFAIEGERARWSRAVTGYNAGCDLHEDDELDSDTEARR